MHTRAFRRADFSVDLHLPPSFWNAIAVVTGACCSIIFQTPAFHPGIGLGISKVAMLVVFSLLLTRGGILGQLLLFICLVAIVTTSITGIGIAIMDGAHRSENIVLTDFKMFSVWVASCFVAMLLLRPLLWCITAKLPILTYPVAVLCFKVITALGLACLPLSQAKLAASSHYRYFSIPVAVQLVILSSTQVLCLEQVEDGSSSVFAILLQMVDTILPILFFWSVLFPLPAGISLKVSFYMLFSLIAAVLVGNLQIPVAFLQVLLSFLRLCSLLGHHHHDYQPLQDGASPNLVPSIVVFYMLELCQGSSYVLATILGFISLPCCRSLVRDLGFREEWGAKAVNLYYHQAYQQRTENSLFTSEKYTPSSLTSFAIQSLGCTSSEIQLSGLHILDSFLEQWDSKSKTELITEFTSTPHKAAVSSLIDMLSSTVEHTSLLATRIIKELTASGSIKISEFPGMVKQISSLFVADNRHDHGACLLILQGLACDADNCSEIAKDAAIVTTKIIGLIRYFTSEENGGGKQHKYNLHLSLNLLRRLAVSGRKIGVKFRRELSENPFLLNSLQCMLDLDLEECQLNLWEPIMDILAKLAFDEVAKQEIGSSQAIIGKLIRAFLRPDDDANSSENHGLPLRMAAGEALANLTITSTDNCWAILLAEVEPEHDVIVNLVNLLDSDYYISITANLLHNLCANSGDKLVELGKQHLESAVRKVMELIMTRDGKQLEAALCVASQIGYAIPKYCAQMLGSADTNFAVVLVEKLLNTLSSVREPCLQYPRLRRVLVEVIISIVDLCPRYINLFREKRAKDALDMVKGTPSRLEKYRVFLGGEGVVAEILPMCDLVDKAKRLIQALFRSQIWDPNFA